jgi:hypothetical protein
MVVDPAVGLAIGDREAAVLVGCAEVVVTREVPHPLSARKKLKTIGDQLRLRTTRFPPEPSLPGLLGGESAQKVTSLGNASGSGPDRSRCYIAPARRRRVVTRRLRYLSRNPNGYCPIHATGVKLTWPVVAMEQV